MTDNNLNANKQWTRGKDVFKGFVYLLGTALVIWIVFVAVPALWNILVPAKYDWDYRGMIAHAQEDQRQEIARYGWYAKDDPVARCRRISFSLLRAPDVDVLSPRESQDERLTPEERAKLAGPRADERANVVVKAYTDDFVHYMNVEFLPLQAEMLAVSLLRLHLVLPILLVGLIAGLGAYFAGEYRARRAAWEFDEPCAMATKTWAETALFIPPAVLGLLAWQTGIVGGVIPWTAAVMALFVVSVYKLRANSIEIRVV
jgi:hypothetical protein